MDEVRDELSWTIGVQPHAGSVRVSHWIVTVSLLTLAFSGLVILMTHPRVYRGDAGNDLTTAARRGTFRTGGRVVHANLTCGL